MTSIDCDPFKDQILEAKTKSSLNLDWSLIVDIKTIVDELVSSDLLDDCVELARGWVEDGF